MDYYIYLGLVEENDNFGPKSAEFSPPTLCPCSPDIHCWHIPHVRHRAMPIYRSGYGPSWRRFGPVFRPPDVSCPKNTARGVSCEGGAARTRSVADAAQCGVLGPDPTWPADRPQKTLELQRCETAFRFNYPGDAPVVECQCSTMLLRWCNVSGYSYFVGSKKVGCVIVHVHLM